MESNGLFREAFVRRFQTAEEIEVVGQIDHLDPAALPAEVEVLEPDIVLVGVGVADSDTLAAVNRVLAGRRHPGVVLHGRSLTLPAAVKVAEILRAIDRGFAYLDTDRIDSVDGLVAITRVVAEGKVVIDPQTTRRLLGLIHTHMQALGLLTEDERQMLGMMARGETDDAIAEALGTEPGLVSAMVVDVASKFGVEGASRDARVTTILRYLVATGELPMDYDTGAAIQEPPRSRIPRSVQAAPKPPADQAPPARAAADESDDEPQVTREPFSRPQALEPSEPEPDQSDEPIVDIFPPVRTEPPPPAEPERPSSSRATEASFRYGQEGVDEFAQFSHQGKPEDVEVALRVLEWAAGRGLRVRWGSRSSGGSFALVLDVGNLSFWLLTVWAIGTVEVQFAMMLAQPPFSDLERRRDLANRLNLIQGVRIDESALSGRPRVPLTSLRDQEDWELFTSAMDWALDEIRAFFQPAHQHRDAGK